MRNNGGWRGRGICLRRERDGKIQWGVQKEWTRESSGATPPRALTPSARAHGPLLPDPGARGSFNGAAEGAAGGAGGAQWASRSVTSRRREASGEGGGRPAGAGRPEEVLAAGWDPRGAAAHLACSAPTLGDGGGTMPFDFRRFDIYRKVPKDLTQPTYTGAIISICCCLFILFLFLSELTGFITTEIVNELYVDDPDKDSGGKIDVSLNISLPNLHCELVGLDIQDEMGRHEVGHIDNSMKIPLNNGAGCRFEGQFSINKVQNVHGAFNALGGADRLTSNPLASHDYILKIVPTVYEDKSGKQRYSYQYTVANKEYVAYSHTGRIIPAIWFRYDLSPITVKYTERRQPLYRFITTICAIIGGTFTVAGILDSCIFTASEAWKKIQLGKMH
ncbi:endoplasmic reticulum-Golgi intermediate compartment protein 1 isoform X2 [Camelus ferus]|uniref:Endoplasmic reticulum-Golgi intermediate compartment protein n=2 Tax=Camelus TaxID=9836 RepID=A0A8B8RSQ5_CAMFR|nr:endoplasmic reticulum-Golgi intermediate compartment protein 1 isoform X2 [Camelus ferus]